MSVKQMKPFMTNVFLNAENEISDFLVASCFNRVIVLNHTTRLILSPFLETNQSVEAVDGCHQIIFFCNIIKLIKVFDGED
jgi:hypothetical protein